MTQTSKFQIIHKSHPKKSKMLWLFIGLVSFALLTGFFVPSIIQKLQQTTNLTNSVPFKADKSCALSSQTCQINGVDILLDTDVAKPLTRTQIQVSWPNNTSETLILTLRGLEMDLGVVKFLLTKQTDGSYLGDITLPICTEAKMTWIGTLTDNNQQTVYTSIRMEK